MKEGFVNTVKQQKGTVLDSSRHNLFLRVNDEDKGMSSLAYPAQAVSYYDGTGMVSTNSVTKDEILLSPDMLMLIVILWRRNPQKRFARLCRIMQSG